MDAVKKDASYHRAAIEYNARLADFASDLAESIEHPEPQRWCRAVAKQHTFHAKRHQKALERLTNPDVDNRDAKSGRYVTEAYASLHPATTVSETHVVDELQDAVVETEVYDDVPVLKGDIHSPFAIPTPAAMARQLSPEELFERAKAEADAAAAEKGNNA